MYKPEALIDVAMEKLYRHNYCLVGNEEVELIEKIKDSIANHIDYNKYKVSIAVDDTTTRIELVGKQAYSY